MDFRQTFIGEADKKYLDMLDGKTKPLTQGVSVDDASEYCKHNSDYQNRLKNELEAYNGAIERVNRNREQRLEREKQAENARLRGIAKRKYTVKMIFKALTILLPVIVMVLIGCDIFINREYYAEVTGEFGWITAGWVILTLLVLLFVIRTFIKMVRKETFEAYRAHAHYNIGAAIICLVFAIVACCGNLAGYAYVGVEEVNSINIRIRRLPDSVSNHFDTYEDTLQEINREYSGFDFWQKYMVNDREEFEELIAEFNEYYIGRMRDELGGVTASNAAEKLQSVAEMYKGLTKEQRKLLTDEESERGDRLCEAYDIVIKINEIEQDILNRYEEVGSVKEEYNSLPDEYRGYVYNSELLNEFKDRYQYFNSFEYTETDGGYSISLKSGYTVSGDITIPSSYEGQPVVEIAEYAFKDNTGITSVVVPESVKTIYSGAFGGCTSLREITLPFIGKTADTETERWAVLGYIFGDGDTNTDMSYNKTQYVTSGTSGFTSQAPYTSSSYFYHAIPQSLRKVTVTSQTVIPAYAFRNCDLLEEVIYEKTVTSIGKYAFSGCSNLPSFTVESGLKTIGNYAFSGCSKLSGFAMENGVETIGEGAFYNCKSFDALNLPSSLTTIGAHAFHGMNQITSVTIPDSVTKIGLGAFYGWTSLYDITLPFIGGTADTETERWAVFGYIFGDGDTDDNMSSNSSEYVTSGTSGFTSQAPYTSSSYFYHAIPQSLRKVTVTSQTVIPAYAFRNCDLLEEVIYEKTVTSIGKYAFSGCSKLPGFAMESGLKTIGERAFYNCKSFDALNLPSGLTDIGQFAFYGMNQVTSVTIPDSVTKIGYSAFCGWTSLNDITLPFVGNTISTGTARYAVLGYIFGDGDTDDSMNPASSEYETSGTSGFTSQAPYSSSRYYYYYAIPQSLRKVTVTKQTSVPAYAFHNCDLLEEVVYSSISSRGTDAFSNCSATVTDLSKQI